MNRMQFLLTLSFSILCFHYLLFSQPAIVPLECEQAWVGATKGDDLGRTGFITADIDNDGVIEIVTGANDFAGSSTEHAYWYVMEYTESAYKKIDWASPYYEENPITCVTAFDIDQDQIYEVMIGFEDGQFQVYNGQTLELTEQFDSGLDKINRMIYSDFDNDGTNEVLISSISSAISYNPSNWSVEQTIPYGGTVAIGNVDDDSLNETVFEVDPSQSNKGAVLEFNGTNMQVEWDSLDLWFKFGLADIDNDDKQELISNPSSNRIDVFDVDLQELKYEIPIDLGGLASVFHLYDTNNDGIVEAVLGKTSNTRIQAYDLVTSELLWEIDDFSLPSGVGGISFVDIDDDTEVEMVYARGFYTTAPDEVVAVDLDDLSEEWNSGFHEGHFLYYATDIADVDLDDELEIVYLSYEDPYIALIALNASTKELEWKMTFSTGLSDLPFWYVGNLKIGNIDDDLAQEIVIVGSIFNDPAVYVVDANNLTIEASYTYPESGLAAVTLASVQLADVDTDGDVEIIAGGRFLSSGAPTRIYIIDGNTGTLEWNSDPLPPPGTAGLSGLQSLEIGNIDADPQLEIVATNSILYVYDGLTHQEEWSYSPSTGPYEPFTVALVDVDNNGQKEIIAAGGDNFDDTAGKIQIIDGTTFDILMEYPTYSPLINALLVKDLNQNGTLEYFFGAGGSLFYFEDPSFIYKSQGLAPEIGQNNNIFSEDFNGDGQQELLINSSYALHEFQNNCFSCLLFAAEGVLQAPNCPDYEDGAIELNLQNANLPVQYNWSTGDTSATLAGLGAGIYDVSLTDAAGCILSTSITLNDPVLEITTTATDASCNQSPDGTIAITVTATNTPYQIAWSNGSVADTIFDLFPGINTATITDNNGCMDSLSAEVMQAFSEVTALVHLPNCNDLDEGSVLAFAQTGLAPYTYEWSNTATNDTLFNLSNGTYYVTLTDALNCTAVDSVVITSAYLESMVSVNQNSCNDAPDGSATIEVIEGLPPYQFDWSDGTNSPMHNTLQAGAHEVTVLDGNGCSVINTVTISETILQIASDIQPILCYGDSNGHIAIDILQNTYPIVDYFWDTGDTSLAIDNLMEGSYLFTIVDSTGCSAILMNTLPQPGPIELMTTSTPDSTGGISPNGTATVVVSGGTSPYTYDWGIPGQTEETATGLLSGTYIVTVIDANDCLATATVEVGMVSSQNNLALPGTVQLSPNPVSDQLRLTMQFPDTKDVMITLFDAQGQLIEKQDLGRHQSGQIFIPVQSLAVGWYVIKLTDKKGQYKLLEFLKM